MLLIAVVLTTILISCNSGGGDPKTVLMTFFDALSKKDMSTARKLSTSESKSMMDLMETGMKMGENKDENKYDKANMQFGDAKIDGDKAIVPVKDTKSGETINYTLKKESGSWKVAFDKATMMTMGMDKMKEKGMNTDSITNQLKNINLDSLKNKMQDATKQMEDATKEMDTLVNHH